MATVSFPELAPNERVTGSRRADLGAAVRARYEDGASIRTICDETGYSIGRVRGLLRDAGAVFRGRGARPRHTTDA